MRMIILHCLRWIKLRRSNKILVFSLIYIICFIYSFFFSTVYNDEIWNYGFSYNIASGLVPYRDFGMLQTPLYFFLASFFIRIFGNYLFSFHLFNSFILAGIIYIIFKTLKYKGFILIPFIFLSCYPGYNIFSVLILLIILCLTGCKSSETAKEEERTLVENTSWIAKDNSEIIFKDSIKKEKS